MEKTFTLVLNGIEYDVEIHGNTFIVNGHPFVVGFQDEQVTVDGIAYDVKLEGSKAFIEGIAHEYEARGLVGEAAPTAGPQVTGPAPTAAGAGAILAIMPGTIVRTLADEGDTVNAGDVVLVLEAMKMENELQAPISGVVKAVYVEAGQAVEMNAVLAEIEPAG